MLGWTRGNMRDGYGSGPWVLMLAEVMNRVEYPGLDLSHLPWAVSGLGAVAFLYLAGVSE